MKNKYKELEIEIVEFGGNDIITESGDGNIARPPCWWDENDTNP